MNVTKRPRIQAISGLRIAAAAHVLAYHAYKDHYFDGWNLAPWAEAFVASGYTTTSMFLVLSGFMLYYGYIGQDGAMRVPARTLWRGRFAALYPTAILGQLLALPFAIVGTTTMALPELAWRLGAAFTITQAWQPTVAFTLDAPAWTLSCLAFYYVLFPWLGPAVARRSNRTLLAALAGTWVVAQAFAWTYLALNPTAVAAQATDPTSTLAVMMHSFPLVRFWEFLSGIILARLLLDGELPERAVRVVSHIPVGAVLAGIAFVLVALQPRVPFAALHNGMTLPMHWLLITGLAFGTGRVRHMLGNRFFAALGESSLPLFMMHVPLLAYGRWALARGYVPDAWWATLLILLAIVASCDLLARWVVRPLAARLKEPRAPQPQRASRPARAQAGRPPRMTPPMPMPGIAG